MNLFTSFSQLTPEELDSFSLSNAVNFNRQQLNNSIDYLFRLNNHHQLHMVNNILESALDDISKIFTIDENQDTITTEKDS